MVDMRTGKDLKDIPVLEEPLLRIYIMHNTAGKIKIGKNHANLNSFSPGRFTKYNRKNEEIATLANK